MGATIINNFDLGAALPLDSRAVKNTIAERNAIPSYKRYEGLIVYVRDTQKNYQLRAGVLDANWVDIG